MAAEAVPVHFLEILQHSLSRCNYDLYELYICHLNTTFVIASQVKRFLVNCLCITNGFQLKCSTCCHFCYLRFLNSFKLFSTFILRISTPFLILIEICRLLYLEDPRSPHIEFLIEVSTRKLKCLQISTAVIKPIGQTYY